MQQFIKNHAENIMGTLRGYPKMIRRFFWGFKPRGRGSEIVGRWTAQVVGA
jgi:hypothetical protein